MLIYIVKMYHCEKLEYLSYLIIFFEKTEDLMLIYIIIQSILMYHFGSRSQIRL